MSKVNTVSVTYSEKASVNYVSKGFSHSLTAEVGPGENAEEVGKALFEQAKAFVKKRIKEDLEVC